MSWTNKIWNKDNALVINEDSVLAYVEGKLSLEQQHVLETLLEEDLFLNDAVEGLFEVKDKEHLKQITAQINLQLKRQIKNRKQQRSKPRIKITEHWGWLYVLVVLILVLLSWWVIKMTMH